MLNRDGCEKKMVWQRLDDDDGVVESRVVDNGEYDI